MSDLPAGLCPPEVALARLADTIPRPDALLGGSLYEPKWDGFGLVIVRDTDEPLWSRQGKDLTRHFPDLAAAAREQLPEGYVIDAKRLCGPRTGWTSTRCRSASPLAPPCWSASLTSGRRPTPRSTS